MAYSSGRVIEHECTGDEELLVKNLGIKNYKAASVGVTKFSPLHDKVLEETGKKNKERTKELLKRSDEHVQVSRGVKEAC